jgi:hypothetical protein
MFKTLVTGDVSFMCSHLIDKLTVRGYRIT